MGQIFGKEKPLKEVMRENKRMITRAVRELDREKLALEREEKRLTLDIKKAAKEGQMGSVKIMAKVCTLHVLLVNGKWRRNGTVTWYYMYIYCTTYLYVVCHTGAHSYSPALHRMNTPAPPF